MYATRAFVCRRNCDHVPMSMRVVGAISHGRKRERRGRRGFWRGKERGNGPGKAWNRVADSP